MSAGWLKAIEKIKSDMKQPNFSNTTRKTCETHFNSHISVEGHQLDNNMFLSESSENMVLIVLTALTWNMCRYNQDFKLCPQSS